MTLSDISNKKDKLAAIYKVVRDDLESRTDWQSYKSDKWILEMVGIMDCGSILAVVVWNDCGIFNKKQYVGMSWENAFNAASIDIL